MRYSKKEDEDRFYESLRGKSIFFTLLSHTTKHTHAQTGRQSEGAVLDRHPEQLGLWCLTQRHLLSLTLYFPKSKFLKVLSCPGILKKVTYLKPKCQLELSNSKGQYLQPSTLQ